MTIALFPTHFKSLKNSNIQSSLRKNDLVLNVAENTLSLKDPITQNVLALEINTEINTGIARVCQTITILPMSITSVQVKDQSILLEPSPALPELGLVGAKCLIDTVNNEMHFMQIINPIEEPITLSRNTCVASACCINSHTVASLDTPSQTKPSAETQEPKQSISFDLSSSYSSLDQKQILHAFLQNIGQSLVQISKS